MNKVLQDLSLCKRAGKLALGFDAVRETAVNKTANLLVVSEGASKNTQKELQFLADQHNIPLIQISDTLNDLWYALGKRVGVMSVTDKALGELIALDASQATAKWEEKLYDTKEI